ncbi:hypothetical protein [Nocardioides panzhihuensis]|uniref:Uncharacterized protein n=1 Tax=Nocardioides panzhihuensis TaxID=860243 RepID=A0A7Z0DKK8_9ACTN|nr:hypothetical protein [Nocardioides panzhihuensis]NYI77034.1 hypothetical protein [Nocardioides panzhihuensis]
MTPGDNQTPTAPGEHETPPGMPSWVKFLIGALLAVILVAVLAMVLVGGDHGPGRHSGGIHSAPAADEAARGVSL